jgi:hypothetical protein
MLSDAPFILSTTNQNAMKKFFLLLAFLFAMTTASFSRSCQPSHQKHCDARLFPTGSGCGYRAVFGFKACLPLRPGAGLLGWLCPDSVR